MHMTASGIVAELLETWMIDVGPQDREPSTKVRCRSAIDVRRVRDLDGARTLAVTGGWVRRARPQRTLCPRPAKTGGHRSERVCPPPGTFGPTFHTATAAGWQGGGISRSRRPTEKP